MLLEHPLSHVIVFSAAFQFHVRFLADFCREGVVSTGLASLVAPPGPGVHVDARSLPGGALRAKLLVQFVRVPERVGNFHVAFHNLRVPDLMKIGRIIFALLTERVEERFMAKIFHRHAVSAVVGIGDGMQRLMQIADKMDEVAYRFGALQGIGGLVFQDGGLLFDCTRHTSLRTAISVQLPLMFPPRNIDVMPGTVLALIAHIVRPCRGIYHEVRRGIAAPAPQLRIHWVVAKNLLNKWPRFGGQMLFCNQGYGLVTFTTPCVSGRSGKYQKLESARKKQAFTIH